MDDLLSQLAALPPGEALFDMDGTLLAGDVGESVTRLLHDAGRLSPELDAALGGRDWDRYRALSPVDQAILCARSLAGTTQREIDARVDEAFATGMVTPRPEVVELAAAMGAHHRVWVLSGSAEAVVIPAAARLGLSRVMGLRSAWEGDRLTDRVEHPVPTDEGKIRVAWWRLGRRPVFAIGDSPWDLPLLRHARVARTTGRIAGVEFPAWP